MNRIVIALTMLAATSAFAGKEEREFRKEKVDPAIAKAIATFKTSCGCALKFDVKWDGFANTDHLSTVRNMADAITEGAPGYCKDDDSKKAMCALKSIELKKGSATEFTFAGGKGSATNDGQSSVSWDMITGAVDK